MRLRDNVAALTVRCNGDHGESKHTEVKLGDLTAQQRIDFKSHTTHSAEFTLQPTSKGAIPIAVRLEGMWLECRSTFVNAGIYAR
jgi:hypothetical protein